MTRKMMQALISAERKITMAEENKKPDYTDLDWSWLIRDREEKWAAMLQEADEKGWKKIPLRQTEKFTSQLILLPIQEETRGIFLVCPGGGFMFKSSNEGKEVAEYFHGKGINTAILDYHVGSGVAEGVDARTEAGEDALAAVRYLRAHAEELGILPDHIAVGGFSAGGMTTSYASTRFDYGDPAAETAEEATSSRPDAALVLYGAFSSTGMKSGPGAYSIEEQQKAAAMDPIRNIRIDTPPTFVFQTHKDDPRNALNYCMELANKGVPYEIHTFEDGPHGGALYDGNHPDSPLFPHTAMWAEIAADWLKSRGF